MKRIIIPLLHIILFSVSFNISAQTLNTYDTFVKYSQLINSGDFLNAEALMLKVLESKEDLSDYNVAAALTNLGILNKNLGNYREAMAYYNQAEFYSNKVPEVSSLQGDIFVNKALLYSILRSYDLAIEYLDKSIRIYNRLKTSTDKSLLKALSSAYLNRGLALYEISDYKAALENFTKSVELKQEYNLTGLGFVYLNFAKNYAKTDDNLKAEEYFLKSIARFKKENNENYYRLVDVFFDYGLFLRAENRSNESYIYFRKALTIALNNYNSRNTVVSLSYKHLGDHYLFLNNPDSALYYYQQSLISVVSGFNNTDIFSNPPIDSALFNISLLDNLKRKSTALEMLADSRHDPDTSISIMRNGLATIDLALQLIDRIRNDYISEESRIYLAENEKETYILAAHIAERVYLLSREYTDLVNMYDIAKKAKSAILRNEITENEFVWSEGISDSLLIIKNRLYENISAYNNLIAAEMRKKEPDSNKLVIWKDALFEMNRENERVEARISEEYPQFNDILLKAEPLTLKEIQKHLTKKESVIDYLLSNRYENGKRQLYIFLVTKDSLRLRQLLLDSLFIRNVNIIQTNLTPSVGEGSGDFFIQYTGALSYMYEKLIHPLAGYFNGNRLIIIPDEEIGLLPFDAFLTEPPSPDQKDFEGLRYMINDYAISYGYSSSMIFSKEKFSNRREEVIAFSPGYESGNLKGADSELDAIYKLYKGRRYSANEASESNFRTAILSPAIFHLAMHSLPDSSNSRFSYMAFANKNDTLNDGKLYNYEISVSRIKSPMVVLSACNSGTGTLYYGEGVMSLARSFMLAGASSVLKTGWKVNDETSAAIISLFYKYLSEGESKDDALRMAKIDFIKTHPPVYSNPYYWAAYEVLGDNSSITLESVILPVVIIIMVLGAAILVIYFRRRRIFSARSL